MKIAIYSRKSKYSDKGESLENQVQMCKEEAFRRFSASEDDFCIYEDEGFSGGTIERPQFQQLLADLRAHQFDVLICYRLDRISRSVADFSTLATELERLGVSFVSVKEQFDTSTPIGRAMMYISSVFAQLERETITERIRDNMSQLAKTGRWLGGSPPLGYYSAPLVSYDANGLKRTQHYLEISDGEVAIVRMIFSKFVELGSITKLESYCAQNDIKNPRTESTRFHANSLRSILSNPVYCPATSNAYHFLKENNYNLYADLEEFDGTRGLIAYGKTDKTPHSTKRNNVEDWIVSIGLHQGILEDNTWIAAQRILISNKSKNFRRPRTNPLLLSGLLVCADCGRYMRPRSNTKNGVRYNSYYLCEQKELTRGTKCKIINAPESIDQLVLDAIKNLAGTAAAELIGKQRIVLSSSYSSCAADIEKKQVILDDIQNEVKNLLLAIAQAPTDEIRIQLFDLLEEKNSQAREIEQSLQTMREQAHNYNIQIGGIEAFIESLSSASSTIDTATLEQKRAIVHTLIHHITWDGKQIKIYFRFFPTGDDTPENDFPPTSTSSLRSIPTLAEKTQQTLLYTVDLPPKTPALVPETCENDRIRNIRLKLGITQKQLSKLSGLSRRAIIEYELGRRNSKYTYDRLYFALASLDPCFSADNLPTHDRLRYLRAANKLYLRDVAKAVNLSHSYIAKIECGILSPDKAIQRLFNYYSEIQNNPK